MSRIQLQLVFSILVLSTGLADTGLSADDTPEIQWGKEVEGVRFGISPLHPSFRYDQPVLIKMLIKNVGEKKTQVRTGDYLAVYRFDVRMPTGEPAPLTQLGSRLADDLSGGFSLYRLEAGETYANGIMLDRYYDMTLLGEYTVTVYHIRTFDQAEQKWIELPSNTLKVVVRDYNADDAKQQQQQESNEK